MAVDDAGRRRQQSRDAIKRRFETLRLRGGEPLDIVDAIGARRGRDLFEGRDLALVGGDDQLAELGMRNPVVAAIAVEPLAPGDAACRLEAAGRVIDPAMDDLAVARGGLEADRPGALEHKHLAAGERQCPRGGEPDHPGTDHDAFDFVHHPLRRRSWTTAAVRGRT